jgi:Zn-finger nucleic acid-binding protein
MKCPTDGSVLVMSERSGVEIDYCPTCRGVWLDRGELDKILERAERESASAAAPVSPAYGAPSAPQGYAPPAQDPYGRQPDPRYGQSGYSQPGYDQGHRRKKKEHWLSDLFD